MKTIILLISLLISAPALAVPTGTVTRAVITDTNGVLSGTSTNFAAVNALATSETVAAVVVDLTTVSNLTVSAISSAAVAQASADYAMTTGKTAQATVDTALSSNAAVSARVTGIETNHATAAQGLKADRSAATNQYEPGKPLIVFIDNTNSVLVAGAGTSAVNGEYTWTGAQYENSNATYRIVWWSSGLSFPQWCIIETTLDPDFPVPDGHYYMNGSEIVTSSWTQVNGSLPVPAVSASGTATNTAIQISQLARSALQPDGSGANLTGIVPSTFGAAWHTNTVVTSVETNELGAVTNITTGTIIYLGAP